MPSQCVERALGLEFRYRLDQVIRYPLPERPYGKILRVLLGEHEYRIRWVPPLGGTKQTETRYIGVVEIKAQDAWSRTFTTGRGTTQPA